MGEKRALSIVAISASLALALTACGGGGGESGGDGETLKVWIMEGTNPDADAYFKEVGAAFKKKTGTEVDVQIVPWADAHQKFQTAIAGNTMPDVAEVGTTWTPEFAEAGALADLTERAGDTGAYVEGLAEAGTIDGKLYGIPWYAGVRSVLYRTDLFEKHDIEVPKDWKELRAAAKKLAEEEKDMTAFPVAGDASYFLLPFVWGAGGELATESDGKFKGALDSPEAREGISYFTDLALKDKVSTTGATTWMENDVQDNFIDGKVAMTISGSWTPKAITEAEPELKEKIAAFPIPGQDGGLAPSFLGGSHLAAFNGDNEDRSWEYIEMVTNDKYAKRWSDETTYFPGKEAQLEPYVESDDQLVQPFAQQMAEAGKGLPVTADFGKIEGKRMIQTMMQSILKGDASVEEATTKTTKDMDEVFGGS